MDDASKPPSVARLRDFFEGKGKAQTPMEFNGPGALAALSAGSFLLSSPGQGDAMLLQAYGSKPAVPPVRDPHQGFRAFAPPEQKNKKTKKTTSPSVLKRLTLSLLQTYRTIHPALVAPYQKKLKQSRILTKDLSKPFGNDGYDNRNADLILTQGDVLRSGDYSFRVLELLGQGTFGESFKLDLKGP
jgi:hypothetical protein